MWRETERWKSDLLGIKSIESNFLISMRVVELKGHSAFALSDSGREIQLLHSGSLRPIHMIIFKPNKLNDLPI